MEQKKKKGWLAAPGQRQGRKELNFLLGGGGMEKKEKEKKTHGLPFFEQRGQTKKCSTGLKWDLRMNRKRKKIWYSV